MPRARGCGKHHLRQRTASIGRSDASKFERHAANMISIAKTSAGAEAVADEHGGG
jgi:hypothetical protein